MQNGKIALKLSYIAQVNPSFAKELEAGMRSQDNFKAYDLLHNILPESWKQSLEYLECEEILEGVSEEVLHKLSTDYCEHNALLQTQTEQLWSKVRSELGGEERQFNIMLTNLQNIGFCVEEVNKGCFTNPLRLVEFLRKDFLEHVYLQSNRNIRSVTSLSLKYDILII